MVQDKTTGSRKDLTIAPIKSSTLALSYYASTFLSTLLICFAALAVCLVYLARVGWFLTAGDVALLVLDVVLLVLFGTALSSCVIFPLSTNGQASAVGTIISAGYGFICGAYMPISSFSEGIPACETTGAGYSRVKSPSDTPSPIEFTNTILPLRA